MISVVIRTKNQYKSLSFLLKNLTVRYGDDIDEIIVLDNCSTDRTEELVQEYSAKFVSIKQFSYGGSANVAASEARNECIVIFSAHSYPVSHDFFKLIRERFRESKNLAGLRCLHGTNDYRAFIKGLKAKDDPNRAGLIFSGSAFRKSVWEKFPFREDVATFEDKEWSKRVLEAGYDIEFIPAIFHYEIKRTKKQEHFRFKNDLVGNYQLWGEEVPITSGVKGFVFNTFMIIRTAAIDLWYSARRVVEIIRFNLNKPEKF